MIRRSASGLVLHELRGLPDGVGKREGARRGVC